jgi:hypothetical protein
MALYLGNSGKLKINLGGDICSMNLFTVLSITEDTILSSSDDYILKDFNGLYLSPKEEG